MLFTSQLDRFVIWYFSETNRFKHMKKMRLNNPETFSERSSKKDKDENTDKRQPHPDDANQEKGPPIKEMPVNDRAHQEDIPDRIPE